MLHLYGMESMGFSRFHPAICGACVMLWLGIGDVGGREAQFTLAVQV